MLESKHRRKHLCAAVLAAALVALPAGAFAWQHLSPAQVADRLQQSSLAQYFETQAGAAAAQSAEANGYRFTLLGVAHSAELAGYLPADTAIEPDHLYVVVATERTDGAPMSDADPEFLVTPLLQGYAPWQVNIFFMHGGYASFDQDGVRYRLVDCDDVAAFGDRAAWLGITDDIAPGNTSFLYDAATGDIAPNPETDGVSILFDLALDPQLADADKARQLLSQWGQTADNAAQDSSHDLAAQVFAEGVLIEEKPLEQNAKGDWWFHYGDGGEIYLDRDSAAALQPGEIGDVYALSSDGETWNAARFRRDAQGNLYGQLYSLPAAEADNAAE